MTNHFLHSKYLITSIQKRWKCKIKPICTDNRNCEQYEIWENIVKKWVLAVFQWGSMIEIILAAWKHLCRLGGENLKLWATSTSALLTCRCERGTWHPLKPTITSFVLLSYRQFIFLALSPLLCTWSYHFHQISLATVVSLLNWVIWLLISLAKL